MLKIMLNKARKHYRKKQVHTVPLDTAVEVAGNAEGLEEAVEPGEQAHRLREALDQLTTHHREVLILRYYNELTVPEIARVLGCSEGTIKSRLSRALRRLEQTVSGTESTALRR